MQVNEGELGSPVDMAKSYMQTRPPWASPSANHIECGSPSPTGIQLFKEETPYSTGYTSFTSSKVFLFFSFFLMYILWFHSISLLR